MGIFDRLRRGKKEAAEEQPSALNDAAAAAAVSPTLDLTEHASASSQTDASAKVLSFDKSEATRLYNPYDGLGAALDRRDVKGPFRLPKEPEFLFIEEAAAHRRSWSENLTYYTGVGYLAGAVLGGGMGAYRAISTPVTLATAEGLPSQRLRINQLLNTSGKLGRSAGNALGVVGLMFSSSESFLRHMNDGALPEDMATVGAGTLTGAIYRSARGPRQAVAAAAVGTFAAAGLLAARNFINSGL